MPYKEAESIGLRRETKQKLAASLDSLDNFQSWDDALLYIAEELEKANENK